MRNNLFNSSIFLRSVPPRRVLIPHKIASRRTTTILSYSSVGLGILSTSDVALNQPLTSNSTTSDISTSTPTPIETSEKRLSAEFTFHLPNSQTFQSQSQSEGDENDEFESADEGDDANWSWPPDSTSNPLSPSLSSPERLPSDFTPAYPISNPQIALSEKTSPNQVSIPPTFTTSTAFTRPPRCEHRPLNSTSTAGLNKLTSNSSPNPSSFASKSDKVVGLDRKNSRDITSIPIRFGPTPDTVANPVTFHSSPIRMPSRHLNLTAEIDLPNENRNPFRAWRGRSLSLLEQIDNTRPATSMSCMGFETHSSVRSSVSSPHPGSEIGNSDTEITIQPSGEQTVRIETPTPMQSSNHKAPNNSRSARSGFQKLVQLFSPPSHGLNKTPLDSDRSKPRKSMSVDRDDPRITESPAPDLKPRVMGNSANTHRAAATSWRSTVSERDYRRVLDDHGADEIRRQQIIWELITTEIDFVQDLRKVLKLFASPLRQASNGAWISGVPKSVGELLDALTTILELHEEIHSALEGLLQVNPRPPILQVAPTLLPFIPHLRIYERYLIKFESVTKLLEKHLLTIPDQDSPFFGEFLRIQSLKLDESDKLCLLGFLLKPVQRLMKYPLFFRDLSARTSVVHPDHFATFELSKVIEKTIRQVEQSKVREDEQIALKMIEVNLRGLPPGFVLAAQGRSLLREGSLARLSPLVTAVTIGRPTRRGRTSSEAPKISPATRPLSQTSDSSERSKSTKSMWSAHSGATSISYHTHSEHEDVRDILVNDTSEIGFHPISHCNSAPRPHRALRSRASEGASLSASFKRISPSSPYMYVMNDLVIFAEPIRRLRRVPIYRILDCIGLSRVIRVIDLSKDAPIRLGEDCTHQAHLELHLEPIQFSSDPLNPRKQGTGPKSTTIIQISLPDPSTIPEWFHALKSSVFGSPVISQTVTDRTLIEKGQKRKTLNRETRVRSRSLFNLSAEWNKKNRPSRHVFHQGSTPPVPPLPSVHFHPNTSN